MKATKQAAPALPKIGDNYGGGTYAGVLTDKAGALYALILLDGHQDEIKWKPALAWAAERQGDLPNRPEAALLFAHLADKLPKLWCWTNEECSWDASSAWSCLFLDGDQSYGHKGAAGACVAVRRLPLESFNPLDSAVKRTAGQLAALRSTARTLLDLCETAELA